MENRWKSDHIISQGLISLCVATYKFNCGPLPFTVGSHLVKPQSQKSHPNYHHKLQRPVFTITIGTLLRRYAEFAAAIVGINETFPHEQMNRLLAVLQEEVTEKAVKLL